MSLTLTIPIDCPHCGHAFDSAVNVFYGRVLPKDGMLSTGLTELNCPDCATLLGIGSELTVDCWEVTEERDEDT